MSTLRPWARRRRRDWPACCQVRRLGHPCTRRTAWRVRGHRDIDGPVWACEICTTRLEREWGSVMVARPS